MVGPTLFLMGLIALDVIGVATQETFAALYFLSFILIYPLGIRGIAPITFLLVLSMVLPVLLYDTNSHYGALMPLLASLLMIPWALGGLVSGLLLTKISSAIRSNYRPPKGDPE